MLKVTDQAGYQLIIPALPKRIVSLVPSQTELLFEMGLENEIIGITKFCVHPEKLVKSKIKIGGTKNINIQKIRSLCPDLVVGNKEENRKTEIEKLLDFTPVWTSDIKTIQDVYHMISALGKITGKGNEAQSISANIENSLKSFTDSFTPQHKMKAAYCIWEKPLMVAGKNTFINHMLDLCMIKNVFSERKERYPIVSHSELIAASPDIILLPSEPYPYQQQHKNFYNQLVPNAKVNLVDGQMFSWYGSRLTLFPAYFKQLMQLW